jgi:hypothetical protein
MKPWRNYNINHSAIAMAAGDDRPAVVEGAISGAGGVCSTESGAGRSCHPVKAAPHRLWINSLLDRRDAIPGAQLP